MRRVLAAITVGVLGSLSGSAFAGSLDLRAGGFFPAASSDRFSDDAALFTVANSDWKGVTGGLELNVRLARNVEMGFSVDGYGRNVDTSYRDFVNADGSEIRQSLKLTIVPVSVELRLIPTSYRRHLAPFIAVGPDLDFWSYREQGNFIDFNQPSHPIIPDSFRSSGVTPGFHVSGGLRIPLSYDVSLVAQGRYQWAKTDMGGDFPQSRLDLGGASATIGINIHF
jgi:hypothetical protein